MMGSTSESPSINCNGKRRTAKDAIQGFVPKLAKLSSDSNESFNHKYILFYSRHIQTPIMLTPMGRSTIGINKNYWALAVLQKTPMDTALVLCEALFSQDQLDTRNQTVGDDTVKIECLPAHLRQAVTEATYWIHEFIKKQKCNHWSYNNARRQELWDNDTNRGAFMYAVNEAFLSFSEAVDQGRLFIIDDLNNLATELGPFATDTDILNSYDDKLVRDLELLILSNDETNAYDEAHLDLIYGTYLGAARQRFGFQLAFPDEQIPAYPSEIVARLTLLSFRKEINKFKDVFCESLQFEPEDCKLLYDRRPKWEDICKSLHYDENNSIWDNLPDNVARRNALTELCRSFTKRFLIRYNKGNTSFNPELEFTSFQGFRKDSQGPTLLLDTIRSLKWYLTTHTFTQVFGVELYPEQICSNIEVEISEEELDEIFGVFQEKFGKFDPHRIDIRVSQPPLPIHTSQIGPLPAHNIQLTAPATTENTSDTPGYSGALGHLLESSVDSTVPNLTDYLKDIHFSDLIDEHTNENKSTAANTEKTSATPGFSGAALYQGCEAQSAEFLPRGFEDLTMPTSFARFEVSDFSDLINEDTSENESQPINTSSDETGPVNQNINGPPQVVDQQVQQAAAHQSQRLMNEPVAVQVHPNPNPQQTRETVTVQCYYGPDGKLTHLILVNHPEIVFPSKIVKDAMETIKGSFDPASYDDEIKAGKIVFEHLFTPKEIQEGGLDFKLKKPRGDKDGFFKSDRFRFKSHGLIALVAVLRAAHDQRRNLLNPQDDLSLGESPYTVSLTLPEGLTLKVLKNILATPIFSEHRYQLCKPTKK